MQRSEPCHTILVIEPDEVTAELYRRELARRFRVLTGSSATAGAAIADREDLCGVVLEPLGAEAGGFGLILWAIPRFIKVADWYGFFVNTVIITACAVVISVALSATAGYAIARKRGVVGAVILIVALRLGSLPPMVFAMPYYQISSMLHLEDSFILVIAVMVGLHQPFAIWMLRGFFLDIPRDIDESAMIDGATRLRAFWSVVAPIAWPGIVAVALLNVLGP